MCYNDCPYFGIWSERCTKPKGEACMEDSYLCPNCGHAVFIHEAVCPNCNYILED